MVRAKDKSGLKFILSVIYKGAPTHHNLIRGGVGEEGGEEQGDGAVAERGEGGLLEPLAERRVRREEEPRHQLLLVVAVREVRRHHAHDAHGHVPQVDKQELLL